MLCQAYREDWMRQWAYKQVLQSTEADMVGTACAKA